MSELIGGFVSELEKIAKDPSWWEKEKGVTRAMSIGGKGIKKVITKPELIGERTLKGLHHGAIGAGTGAGVGAGIGALVGKSIGRGPAAGLGALAGALLGYGIGETHGMYKADVKFLKKRGITPKYLGLSAEFSPAAKKKYIETPMAKR